MKNYFGHKEIYKNCSSSECQRAYGNALVQRHIRQLLFLLNVISEMLGVPIIVNSWYRDSVHNKRVGGVSTSHHLCGGAVDITCDKEHFTRLFVLCWFTPQFTQIILYDNFIHISIVETKNSRYVDKRKID